MAGHKYWIKKVRYLATKICLRSLIRQLTLHGLKLDTRMKGRKIRLKELSLLSAYIMFNANDYISIKQ